MFSEEPADNEYSKIYRRQAQASSPDMAVEAHRLLLAQQGQHKQFTNAAAGWSWTTGDEARCATATMARPSHHHQQAAAAAAFQFQQQQAAASCVGVGLPAPPPVSSATPPVAHQYAAAGGGQVFLGDAAESGVTFGGGAAAQHQEVAVAMAMAPASRKRRRAEPALEIGGAADVAAHFHQQLVDVDRLVLQHTARMWADLTEQRRRHARQVVATVEAAAAKRLRAKEEEIQRLGRLNWALEERVKTLYVEAQVWRDLAQSNEAAANALRAELQQALDAQQQQQARVCDGAAAGAVLGADDAESCCCGENDVAARAGAGAGAEDGETSSSPGNGRTCVVCGEGAAEVLLLPCRHLCACAPCAGAATACPACGCAKNGSVCVNFS